jgi:DNA invertase Pin-like site-specific DNA recombinase
MENINKQPKNWFLYIRKSTDEEGHQVLSIEAQVTELKEFAARENLEISEIFIEKKTAKIPGRGIFNEMVSKIETSKIPVGILAWHPDRLSRNSIDGGRIIYLLDTGKLAGLKFPTFSFENTPAGKFFLSIALSNAKYYIDNLSENVKRGNRQKLRQGEWPGQKPLGYIYDHRLRNIVPSPKTAKIVQKIFKEFATGKYGLEGISKKLAQYGITSKNGKPRSNSAIYNLLTNQLYIGIMKWKEEIYEGKYQPIVSKKIFDKVQEVLKQRGKPRKKRQKHNFPFCGLFRCSCGAAITAQFAKGNGGLYRYYRCTRKFGSCKEKYIQEKELINQICQKLKEIILPADWSKEMLEYLDKEEETEIQAGEIFAQKIN